MIGLWPGLKRLLSESSSTPLPPPPAARAPATTFVASFVCADIAAVIVHAATKPIPLK